MIKYTLILNLDYRYLMLKICCVIKLDIFKNLFLKLDNCDCYRYSDKIDLKVEESMYKSQPAKICQNLRFGLKLLDIRKETMG